LVVPAVPDVKDLLGITSVLDTTVVMLGAMPREAA
jgi:hypothetical protein